MNTNLTKNQKAILGFIKTFQKKNGYSPTLEEIGKKFKLSSSATIYQYLAALDKKGYTKRTKGQPRSIEIIKKSKKQNGLVKIPLLGTIASGQPIEAIEIPDETILVAKNEIGNYKNYYALKVKGNSMIDEGIFDGDIVIIRKLRRVTQRNLSC